MFAKSFQYAYPRFNGLQSLNPLQEYDIHGAISGIIENANKPVGFTEKSLQLTPWGDW